MWSGMMARPATTRYIIRNASNKYDEADYIRDYMIFKKWKNDKNILDFSNDIIHEFGTT
jgi:hypothetical protein